MQADSVDHRIHVNTDMDWVIDAFRSWISWPARSLSFQVGGRQFTYCHRKADRQHVLLVDLRLACLMDGALIQTTI